MKIIEIEQKIIKKTEAKPKKNNSKDSKTSTKTSGVLNETVLISDTSRDIQKAREIVSKTVDGIRIGKVKEIKNQIEEGKYNINSKKIATNMLKNLTSARTHRRLS